MVNQGSWNPQGGALCLTHGYFALGQGSIQDHIDKNLPCDVAGFTRFNRIGSQNQSSRVPTVPQQLPFRHLTQDGSIRAFDYAVYANPAGSAMRIQLPCGTMHAGRLVNVKKVGTNARPVRLLGTIDRQKLTSLVADGDSATLQCVGSSWRLL